MLSCATCDGYAGLCFTAARCLIPSSDDFFYDKHNALQRKSKLRKLFDDLKKQSSSFIWNIDQSTLRIWNYSKMSSSAASIRAFFTALIRSYNFSIFPFKLPSFHTVNLSYSWSRYKPFGESLKRKACWLWKMMTHANRAESCSSFLADCRFCSSA